MVLRKIAPLVLTTLPLLLNACGLGPNTTPPTPKLDATVAPVVSVNAESQTFEGDNPDAGLASGFVAVNPVSAAWSVTSDGSNEFLEGNQGTAGGVAEYVETGVASWTDQTITVRVRLASVVNGSARICGRFTNEYTAYCLEISSGGTGANPGGLSVLKESYKGSKSLGTASPQPIAVGDWHTYRFSIAPSSTGPLTLKAYLDDAPTPTATATDSDNTSPPYTEGAVALGVRDVVTADFDDLVVTLP